jgi:hypothetical protein
MFHSFNADVAKLVKEGQFLQSFSVQVKPCSVRGKEPWNKEVELRTMMQRCSTLKLLKHIHLENFPNLEKLFPCCLSLPALETLIILFCPNLKTIFYKQPRHEVAPSPLPNIKRMYLRELPHLLHIHDDVLFQFETPSWEKLFVQSFHCLPLVNKECVKSKVEVSGVREWWDKLQLRLPEQSDCYLHVAPPMFVSRKNSLNIHKRNIGLP